MKKKKQKNKKMYQRMSFWLGVVILGLAVGVTIQFGRAWVEPSATAPNGNIAAPINTGAVEQTKTGTATQKADICVDPNGDGNKICLSNGGGGGGGLYARCVCKFRGQGAAGFVDRNCGSGWQPVVRFQWQATDGGVTTSGTNYFPCTDILSDYNSNFLVNGNHTTDSCTAAGGEVINDGGNIFCKMDAREIGWIDWINQVWLPLGGTGSYTGYACPSGWLPYSNWTETQQASCTGRTIGGCAGITCTTSSHTWQNQSAERCGYYDGVPIAGSCNAWDPDTGSCISYDPDTCLTDFSYYTPERCNARVIKFGCY